MLKITYSNIPAPKKKLVQHVLRWLTETWGTPISEVKSEGSPGVKLESNLENVFLPIRFEETSVNSKLDTENFLDHLLLWYSGNIESFWSQNKFGHHTLKDSNHLEIVKNASFTFLGESIKAKLFKAESLSSVWPDGKKWAVGLSHDVDYPEVLKLIEPLRIYKRNGFKKALETLPGLWSGRHHHWQFKTLIDLENQRGYKSAFYFCPVKGSLPEYALGKPNPFYDIGDNHFLDLFSKLKEQGFEIGMHASYLAYQSELNFKLEKERLEEKCGMPIQGLRHHYWKMDSPPEKTLSLHENLGFLYDTSLGFEKYLGLRRGFCFPFFPFDESNNKVIKTLQLGTTWMDDHLFSHLPNNVETPIENGNEAQLRRSALNSLIEKVKNLGGLFMVDTHEYTYDDALFPDWGKTYNDFLTTISEDKSVWVAKPSEISKHWIGRSEKIQNQSQYI
jgi:hypothetical protein